MKRRQLVVILVSILAIILILTGILVKISPKERYKQKYSKLEDLYTEKLYQGYDLSEAENVAKDAKEAYNMEDYESAMRFLDEAIIALERAKKAPSRMLPVIWTEGEYMKKKNIDVIYEDYNKFRSSVIQEYQLRQELRKKLNRCMMHLSIDMSLKSITQ